VSHAFSPGGPVLQDLDLEIEAGSLVALLGPSGCGKSTLLRFVSGLAVPSAGAICLTSGDGTPADVKPKLAFVFQDAQLLPWRSVIDNVALPLELQGSSRPEARERARGPLSEVELSDVHDRFPGELSGGMRMRVSIARALVTEPELLLLDEPFAALDELTRQRMDERLRALWLARRMTVIFVTHSLAEAAFLAERALVMSRRPGRIDPQHRSDGMRRCVPSTSSLLPKEHIFLIR
jgi:NitT/TauT family transport system ATP-binding protein